METIAHKINSIRLGENKFILMCKSVLSWGLGGYNKITPNNFKQKRGAWLNVFGEQKKRVEAGGAEELKVLISLF